MSEDPIELDVGKLHRLLDFVQPHRIALLAAIRAEFGAEAAPTLYTVALAAALGEVQCTIAHAERAPAGIAQVWSLLCVPFSLEPKRTN